MNRKLLALILVLTMLLGGCGLPGGDTLRYEDIQYTRPDMDAIAQTLAESCDAALNGTDLSQVEDGIWAFYDAYDQFYTDYYLAYIHYSGDLTDSDWEAEYDFCAENSSRLDAWLEELYYALADSPYREELESEEYFGAGYFDAYEGESIWDETFLSLMEQEAALIGDYYTLSAEASDAEYYSEEYFSDYGNRMGDLFVELVALRQQIAAYAGYASYPEFAYDFYYYRDFTPGQALEYAETIRQELVPLYEQVNASDVWNYGYDLCTEEQMYDYVKESAEAMGGAVAEAFGAMDEGGFYDVSYSENKFDTAFEVYLSSYYMPFVFVSPEGSAYDKLSFAHEFGHFASDYFSGGSYAGIDVAEVFSQSMEYLSLCYAENEGELEQYKLADCLCVYVEQAAYAVFEHMVYSLKGEDLTAENVYALYESVGKAYGFDSWNWDSRDFVAIEHFFTEPMYIISYVVSNDVAFQIYQREKERDGSGLRLFQNNLTSEESYVIYFAESIGLESPFADGRVAAVRKTLEEALT